MFKELFTESDKWLIYSNKTFKRIGSGEWSKIRTAKKNADKHDDAIVASASWFYQNAKDEDALRHNAESKSNRK